MALAGSGLQTHIWNNNAKSIALLLSYPLLILALGWGAAYAYAYMTSSEGYSHGRYIPAKTTMETLSQATDIAFSMAPYLLVGVGIWFVIAYFSHQSLINRATGAKPVTRREQPRIYNMLENLCISRGMSMPQFYIIESNALNAYASGIQESNFAITLTTGIINALDDEALEAVIAHELSHIRNRDVRLLVVSVIFVGIISFLLEGATQTALNGARFRSLGSNSRNNAGQIILIMIIGIAILYIGKFLALTIRFAISRKREFMADAGAVELTKNPDAMIRALRTIEGRADMPDVPEEVQQMFIENASSLMSWFATHPSIDQRVAALIVLGGRDIPAVDFTPRQADPAPTTQPQTKRSPWGPLGRRGPWG
jgi:heat shock protein HtpX